MGDAAVEDKLGYFDYLRAAFNLRPNVGGLGALPLNKLFLAGFAILGFGNPGFWFLGLALESIYLLALGGNSRFQVLVQGRRLAGDAEKWQQEQTRLLASLDQAARGRYDRLGATCRGILQTIGQMGAIGQTGLAPNSLAKLQWVFLRLLISRKKLLQILQQTPQAELEQELRILQDKLARESESSPVHRSLQGTMEIQERRLDNLKRTNEGLKFTEAELDRIEKQARLLSEETAVSGDATSWAIHVDSVMQSVQDTTKWMAEHAELFNTLEDNTPAGLAHAGVREKE